MQAKQIVRMLLVGGGCLVLVFLACSAGSQPKQVYKISIDGMVDRGLAPYVQRVLKEADNAAAVIVEINTLGGLVDAALPIRDALLNAKPTTIAFINTRAISAGALIALATDHIAMSPGGTIGAATPIQIGGGGEANPVEGKYVSYFRAEMRATAEKTGRRSDIAEAMVDAEVEIENVTTKGRPLTLTTAEALKYAIAEHEVVDIAQVLEKYELSGAEVLDTSLNWAERLVRFLTNPMVSGILMMIGFMGLFLEFKTPGFGVPGIVGLTCLGLFFWGHFLVRLAGWEELLLFLAGVILLLIEIFIIPGFGIVGISGIVFIIASLVLSLVGRFELLTLQDIRSALSKVVAALIASLIFSVVLAKLLPRTFIGRQVILQTKQEHADGYIAQLADLNALLGMIGVTLTPLHLSGTIMINEKRYDVVSEGEFIGKNERVRVIDVEGARIVVRKIEKSTEA